MRTVLVVSALLLSSLSVARADEFGGWKFSAPSGFAKQASGDHVTFAQITGNTFCLISLFQSRAPTSDDVASEWKNVLEKSFTVTAAGQPVNRKAKQVPFVAKSATVKGPEGNTYAAALYVLQPQGAVSSVLLVSSTNETLAKCPISPFLDSISLAAPASPPAAPPKAEPAQPAPAAQPAGAPAIAGTWAIGSSAYSQGMQLGSIKQQYVLKSDGTFRYFRETWGGHYRSTWYFTVEQTGTWKLAGDQLTITPTKVNGIEYDTKKNTHKVVKVPIEPATYKVKTVYMSGLNEWNLVLTIAKPTQRDGAYASNDAYPSSYLLSATYKPEWKFGPKY